MLMKRHDVDADAAFVILRRTSQHSNTKLVTVAADLVDRHSATRTIRADAGRATMRFEPSPLRGT